MTRRTRLVATAGAAALLAAVLGTAAASATPSTPAPQPATSTQHTSLQQGDQATPDQPGAPDESENPVEPNGTEKDAVAKEGVEHESATETDGPGGHQDPPGNVDHRFEGEE